MDARPTLCSVSCHRGTAALKDGLSSSSTDQWQFATPASDPHSSGGIPISAATPARIAPPWLTTTTVWPGSIAATASRVPRLHALPHVEPALSPTGSHPRISRVPGLLVLRKPSAYLGERQPLPPAGKGLAKTRVRGDRHPGSNAQSSSGITGALQVGRNNQRRRQMLQFKGSLRGLLPSEVIKGDVLLPLKQAAGVPFRPPVAPENNPPALRRGIARGAVYSAGTHSASAAAASADAAFTAASSSCRSTLGQSPHSRSRA